jgi:hypothetical protein
MDEIIDTIRKLRQQKKEIDNQEKLLLNSISDTKTQVETIYKLFIDLKKLSDIETQKDRRMFVYICLSIIYPAFKLGDRLKMNLRKEIATVLKIQSPCRISHIAKDVTTLYRVYKDFRTEADYLYNSIKRSLTS